MDKGRETQHTIYINWNKESWLFPELARRKRVWARLCVWHEHITQFASKDPPSDVLCVKVSGSLARLSWI